MEKRKRIFKLLKQVLNHILSNPQILYGFYDISFQEVAFIEENRKVPLESMEILAVDHYFEREHVEYNLTLEEARLVSAFLKKGGLDYKYKLLKPLFPFLIKKIEEWEE